MEDIKEIDLSSWTQAGEGATSFTYNNKHDDNIMLKLFKKEIDENEPKKEYELSKHIEELGFVIPRAISLVRANGNIGLIFEKVKNKISFSRMMANDPSKIKSCAVEMARYAKLLHSTPCIPEYFIYKKDQMKNDIINSDFSKDICDVAMKKLMSTKDENTCLHGDFQPANFLDSNGKTYMIDIGNFGYGNHMFDIGALYFSCNIIITEEEKIDLFHMTLPDLKIFFDEFAKAYAGNENLDNFYKEASEYAGIFMIFAYQLLGKPIEKKKIYESQIRKIFGI